MAELGIIPARYKSTRFPGKPLAQIRGKPMIQWVYETSREALDEVVVATDDKRIYKAVEGFGGQALLTNISHENGTSRCLEAFEIYNNSSKKSVDAIINIQGDEPLIQIKQLHQLKSAILGSPNKDIVTLATTASSLEELKDRHNAFVVFNLQKKALYFSRTPLPFVRDFELRDWLKQSKFYKHIGIYAYKPNILKKIIKLAPSKIEDAEKLEQNRWLDHGYDIHVEVTQHKSISVDHPKDIDKIERAWDSFNL